MGQKNKEDSSSSSTTTAILKLDIHCEGCATKIRKYAQQIQGVERVRADWEDNKLTVTGKFDPSKLRDSLALKINNNNNKIDIIIVSSETTNKNKPHQQAALAPDKNTPKHKGQSTPVTTATLKVELHCQGCIQKIYKVVSRTKGVEDMAIERQKDLITVKGKMDVKGLIENLEDKLKRKVGVVVVPKKEKEDAAADKNKSGGDDDVAQPAGGGGVVVTEANKLENVAVPVSGYEYGYGYGNGFVGEHLLSAQMFSDDNPNACSLM